MPTYQLKCQSCELQREMKMTFAEREKFDRGEIPPKPDCKGCGANAFVVIPSIFHFSIR